MTEGPEGLGAKAHAQYAAAAAALSNGSLHEAGRLAEQLWQVFPNDPDVWHLVAGLSSRQGDHVAALKAVQRALATRPDDATILCTRGIELAAVGQLDMALAVLERACGLQPDLWLAWYNLGILRVRAVEIDGAEAAFQKAIALNPSSWSARAHYATLLEMAGRSEDAAAVYREILASHPTSGEAWWGLATVHGGVLGADDVPRMQAAIANPQATDRERVATGFALARVLDATARYTEAMGVLAETHAHARKLQPWDAAGFTQGLDAILSAFAAPVPAAPDAALGRGLIFIVSLPRSGSTLVEQMLASHSQVAGTGELRDLSQVLAEESQRQGRPYPEWVGALRPEDWQRLGERYLERTARWRRDKPFSTDKLPGNWLNVGAIRAMLPGARIIACRRDPIETCLACYRHYLPAGGQGWTHRIADLGTYLNGFDRAVRQWSEQFPAAVYTQGYENLIADPETNMRALLAFCGLPFEPGCLEFHRNPRAVRSPSAAQVREPLRGDTARAARYGSLLDPLRNALGVVDIISGH
ncbi:MAG TPA: sulfotransferase [Rhodanobacteraceae bacterium]